MRTDTGQDKYIVIRQARTKVIGSRVMTAYEAGKEVAAWRDEIGPACYVPATEDVRSMVRRDDSKALAEILCKPWPAPRNPSGGL